MEVKIEDARNALAIADDAGKKLLLSLFPQLREEEKQLPVTERVKTFEDACRELGETHPFVCAYLNTNLRDPYVVEVNRDLLAYLKLRIIAAALNEGWKPQFTDDEWRWHPWFTLLNREELFTKTDEWKYDRHLISIDGYSGEYAGFFCSGSKCAPSPAYTQFSSRICFKSEALATYCGKQFIYLWATLTLIEK